MKNKSVNLKPVALITGGNKRLGKEISLALANVGYEVVINYLHSDLHAKKLVYEINSKGQSAIAIKADITNPKEIKNLISKIIKKYSKLDLLVNNASVFIKANIKNTTEKIWNQTLDTNLKSAFYCSQEASNYMLKKKSGQIINISSIGGLKAFKNYIPYSIAKAGLIMLTKCLAKALSPYILVNAIAPGTINFTNAEKGYLLQNEKNLLKKYALPTDITNLVVFLAQQNKHITGQVFAVDGGSLII